MTSIIGWHWFCAGIWDSRPDGPSRGWKIDVSIWHVPMPPEVEAFQAELTARLTGPLRLSAWQVYDAVLHHDVATPAELDAYLAARGFPTRD